MDWRKIETIPEWHLASERPEDVLLFSARIGVHRGSAGKIAGTVFAHVPNFGGDAVECWGVTHWMPLPAAPRTLCAQLQQHHEAGNVNESALKAGTNSD